MFVALDKNGNRIYADDEQRYVECFCPVCKEPLTHKKGEINRKHFAHKNNSDCSMTLNEDYDNQWHIRMQSFFPKESREFRFEDNETSEIHIADVFDVETNTVIEFQHSSIENDEFLGRTYFHLNNGRRIVWIFDESSKKVKEGYIGKFKHEDLFAPNWKYREIPLEWLYEDKSFQWLYKRRKFLKNGPNLTDYCKNYSIFVYTGENENIVHRIISEEHGFEYVTFSVSNTEMFDNMSTNLFFVSEKNILNQAPWKEQIETKAKELEEKEATIKENQKLQNKNKRLIDRVFNGLDTDLDKCPRCGGTLELKTARKGKYSGQKFYGCGNYPKCKFKENV